MPSASPPIERRVDILDGDKPSAGAVPAMSSTIVAIDVRSADRNDDAIPPVGNPGVINDVFTAPIANPGADAGAAIAFITDTRADAIEVTAISASAVPVEDTGNASSVAALAMTEEGIISAKCVSAFAAAAVVADVTVVLSWAIDIIALERKLAMSVRVAVTEATSEGETLFADKRRLSKATLCDITFSKLELLPLVAFEIKCVMTESGAPGEGRGGSGGAIVGDGDTDFVTTTGINCVCDGVTVPERDGVIRDVTVLELFTLCDANLVGVGVLVRDGDGVGVIVSCAVPDPLKLTVFESDDVMDDDTPIV